MHAQSPLQITTVKNKAEHRFFLYIYILTLHKNTQSTGRLWMALWLTGFGTAAKRDPIFWYAWKLQFILLKINTLTHYEMNLYRINQKSVNSFRNYNQLKLIHLRFFTHNARLILLARMQKLQASDTVQIVKCYL